MRHCATLGCDTDSMGQMIFVASKNAEYWRIEVPAQNWIDDYFDWSDPGLVTKLQGPCCNCKFPCEEFDDFCPANNPKNSVLPCHKCVAPRSLNFYRYLDWFLKDNPGEQCAKSGHAVYGHSVHFEDENNDFIDASSFMTYSSVCISSEECSENTKKTRLLADQIENMLKEKHAGNPEISDITVFPYSLMTPYYEMYNTMSIEGTILVATCFIPVFLVSLIFMGFDLIPSLIVTLTTVMISVNTAAICALWNVQFNPMSIINYITGIGISIEFTAHMVTCFLETKKVQVCLEKMGPAVFAGVTMTNLPAMIVLRFATAKFIEVYFFRMGFTLTLVGFFHGVVFLPCLLTYLE